MKYVKHLVSLLLLYSLVFHIVIPHTDVNNNHGLPDDYLHTCPMSFWADLEHRLSHFEHISSECYSTNLFKKKAEEKKLKQVEKIKFFQFFIPDEDRYADIVSFSKVRYRRYTDALHSCIIHTLSRRGPPVY